MYNRYRRKYYVTVSPHQHCLGLRRIFTIFEKEWGGCETVSVNGVARSEGRGETKTTRETDPGGRDGVGREKRNRVDSSRTFDVD